MQVHGKLAVISGGASGLGEAVARRLVASGARVWIADLTRERGEALERELGPALSFVPCDVTREAEVAALFERARAGGPVQIVVSCAGVAAAKRTLDRDGAPHDLASFQRALEINVVGTFNMARLGAAAIVAGAGATSSERHGQEGDTRGVIVNTASIAAFEGQQGQVAYAASKGAIVAMTLPLARDLAQHAIRVCAICPGTMDTPLLAGLPEAARKSLAALIPFPARLGQPAEFAALVQHVIENDYLNGESLRLDGALRMPAR